MRVDEVSVDSPHGPVAVLIGSQPEAVRAPGVVVLHDVAGMTPDLRRQVEWLTNSGFLVAAPNLFGRGSRVRCIRSVIKDIVAGRGAAFDDVEAVRTYVASLPGCNGRVGVIGFCMGGGFALLLAPGHGFSAVSSNYGNVPKEADRVLRGACPIIATFGARDLTARGAAKKLEAALLSAGVEHEVKEYANAGHSFMNDHHHVLFRLLRVIGIAHEPRAEQDARARIGRFFHRYLDDASARPPA